LRGQSTNRNCLGGTGFAFAAGGPNLLLAPVGGFDRPQAPEIDFDYMKMPVVSWIDLVTVIVVVAGLVRGRKRGISEELLDVIKWVLILVGAAYVYEPLGSTLAQMTPFSLLSCYVAVYATVLVVLLVLFACIRRQIGDKLVSSDAFGNGEYYLGMVAGAFRYVCIMLVIMAFVNARYYSPEEIKAYEAYQDKNYGSQFFPSFGTLRAELFEHSITGITARDYLAVFLIRPTAPEDKSLSRGSVVQGRENDVKQLIEKR
jgi:uncharacterized membrane protein required for colicin V production